MLQPHKKAGYEMVQGKSQSIEYWKLLSGGGASDLVNVCVP